VARGRRAAGAVEVIGDRLAPPALVGPQVKDLGDDRGGLRVRFESRLDLTGLRASRDGCGLATSVLP
jgi:hypothetical protein